MTTLRNPAWISFSWFGMTAGISMLAKLALPMTLGFCSLMLFADNEQSNR